MKRSKNIFFTSDWHLFHEKVMEYDSRPFKDVKHMHEGLVNRYNASVRPKDVCYFLGDIGFGPSGDLKKIITSLNGTKIFILGNHDKGPEALARIGFDAVLNSASMYVANELVTLSHCPLRGLKRENTEGMRGYKEGEHWHGESRHEKYSIDNSGQFHLHGHIHSPNSGKSVRELGRQYDVGVAANNYYPVSISRIEKFIAKVKKEESCSTQ